MVAVALPVDLTWVKMKRVELISGIPVSELISSGKLSPIGVVIVFTLYSFIFIRGMIIIKKTKNHFGALIATGIIAMYFFHFVYFKLVH